MKHWPSQLFPIIILSVLAGLTFWLQSATEIGNDKHDGKFRHDPDGIAENYVAQRFDETGQVRYRLSGPYMVHYPDDDSSELKSPTLISYRPEAPQIKITSNFAKLTAKGEIAYLWDDVRITRAATADRPELLARSPDLTANTEEGTAFTSSPVEITQGNSWVTGVGAQIDNNKSTFVLQSQVKGQYIRPRSTP